MSTPEDTVFADALAAMSGRGFIADLGLRLGELTADRATLSVAVTPRLHQPQGIVHGGVYCAMVETLASLAGAVWFGDRGHVVGVANHTDFLRATRTGTLHGVASPIHRGRTQQLWLVEISDDAGRPIARGQVRLANIASTDHLGSDGRSGPDDGSGAGRTTAPGTAPEPDRPNDPAG